VKPQSGEKRKGREASLKRHAMKEAKRNKENRDRILKHKFNKKTHVFSFMQFKVPSPFGF
jgi:hypothetical protein